MPRHLLLAVAAVLAAPSIAGATYSVVAVDLRTRQVVFALATCTTGPPPSAAPATPAPRRNLTAVIVPGKGVATCQAAVDLTGETQKLVLEQIQKGVAPEDIMRLLRRDPGIEQRQFGIVDLRGRAASFTGGENQSVALDVHGKVGDILFSIQGNILAGTEVVTEAVRAFQSATGSLSDRAMAALEAADARGGDRRCTCETEPRPPAPCRSKTALTARLTLAEPSDPIGEYRLDLSVSSASIQPNEDANPVATLRLRYDAWKKASGQNGQAPSGTARYEPSLFSGLRWRNIGPNRGGRSLTVAGTARRPYEYYAGTVGGGLWKTTDGGTTWKPVTDGQIKSSSVGAVAVSESNPDVVYIGMGETQVQRNMLQGDGVYKSTDGGKTWTHIGLADTQAVSRVVVHPANPDLVYVAAFGHFYGPSDERGVFRSKDGGKTWQKILFRDNRSGAVDLAMARQNPNVLFAAMWQASVGSSGSVSSGGPGSGLFKSTNGGETWTEITRNPGLPGGTIGSIGVAIAGADADRVYAIVEADGGGIFRSDNGGATWTKVNEDGPVKQRPSYFNRIYVDPTNKDVVYAMNLDVFRSTDGARTFESIPTRHADHHDLWIAPDDSRRMINATDGGPSVSVNGGESWTGQAIPTAQLYRVATTKDVPYHVCGAQQDQAAICLPSTQTPWRSVSPYVGTGVDEGRLGGPVYAPGGGEFGMIAPHPRDPELFFATGPSVITRYDRRTGLSTTRDIQVSPVAARGPDRERFSLYALAFSHHDPYVLYTASQHVWRTADGGLRWERISPDLSRPASANQSGRAAGSISAIAPSFHDANTIWAGTDDGLVHVTRDGGKTWQKITPPDLPEFSRISLIEASPNKAGGAYVAAKRFELDDRAPYIFKTADYGKTWTKIVNGIPSNDFVNAVREDPKRAGLLYAGTDHTVFVSFDDGANWQSLALNLPDTSVPDLVVEANDLVIATQGRSFYILDDIGPLRELTPQVTSAALHLFKPRDTIRRLNLPVIDFVLKAPASNVSIEILDSGGHVVRTESTEGKAGLNRFTWDLRYSDAAVFPGLVMWVGKPDGPIAAPGRYQVRVTAGGQTQTQPLTVVRDPRQPSMTDADLQAQFDLALKARDGVNATHEAVILIRRIKSQIQDRIEKAKDNQITSAGEAVNARLSAVEGELYQVKLRGELDATTYPPMLNQHFANLKLSVETGDGSPTEQAYATFKRLSSELDAQLTTLNEVLKTDVPRLNRLLGDRKLAPVDTRPKS